MNRVHETLDDSTNMETALVCRCSQARSAITALDIVRSIVRPLQQWEESLTQDSGRTIRQTTISLACFKIVSAGKARMVAIAEHSRSVASAETASARQPT